MGSLHHIACSILRTIQNMGKDTDIEEGSLRYSKTIRDCTAVFVSQSMLSTLTEHGWEVGKPHTLALKTSNSPANTLPKSQYRSIRVASLFLLYGHKLSP